MNLARLISALIPASGVTMGLLLLMHVLIVRNMTEPNEGEAFTIPDITMPDREISTEYDTRKPDKPDEPEEPPPELPTPEFENPTIDNSISFQPNVQASISIGGMGDFGGDGDYLPIVKVQPRYPQRLVNRGVEGHCVVEFTVTKAGTTKDVIFIESDCTNKAFGRPSVRAGLKFKFKPKIVDGEPVDVPNVRYKFVFKVQKEE